MFCYVVPNSFGIFLSWIVVGRSVGVAIAAAVVGLHCFLCMGSDINMYR